MGAVVVLQTDKASMLDEIIDYVKFLQLQVKVMLLLLNNLSFDPGCPLSSVPDCQC